MASSPGLERLVTDSGGMLTLLARIIRGRLSVWDQTGSMVQAFGEEDGFAEVGTTLPIRIEAEPVGEIRVHASASDPVARLAVAILDQAYTRALVVDTYRETLSDSYEALLIRNRELEKLSASLEQQVRERTLALDRAHARLAQEEKVAAIGRLAAGVAHELNTPLACVRSNLNFLKEFLPGEGEALGILKESIAMTDRAAGIVRDLSGFSHVDDIGEAPLDLNQEVDHALERLAVPPGVKVEKEYAPLPKVGADGRRLTVAILHLLENARDAVAGGGSIHIVTAVRERHVELRIRDSGPGIPPETLGRVFDPFFTTKDVGHGTGLGLTVARDIARAHGGDLTLECPAEGGTVASILIPLES